MFSSRDDMFLPVILCGLIYWLWGDNVVRYREQNRFQKIS